jgi:GDP-4-dehydro-6-deoxy-D-mannose reductase
MTAIHSALVTGATGFIGQHLVRRLVAQNVKTYCLVRAAALSAATHTRLSGATILPLHGDSPADWRQALNGIETDAVFHLASPGVVAGKDSPESLRETNVRLICQLLDVVRHWPLRSVIHAGSFSEYAVSTGLLSEDSPLLPSTLYGASKVAAWQAGRAIALQHGLTLINLRLFHVYGPGEASSRLIPSLHQHLALRQPAALTAGAQIRDAVFIDDVVDALLAAAALPQAREPAAFNICSGVPIAVRQIGELVARKLQAPPALLRWGELPYRPGDPMRAVGDNRRFLQATGWRPRISLDEGVARTLAHLAGPAPARLAG